MKARARMTAVTDFKPIMIQKGSNTAAASSRPADAAAARLSAARAVLQDVFLMVAHCEPANPVEFIAQ